MDASFKDTVYKLIARVPYGQVTTYGDIAALAGHPSAARVVGQIAHFGPEKLPWHRMVNRNGKLANGFWGGVEVHGKLLTDEGVEVEAYHVKNLAAIRWTPEL